MHSCVSLERDLLSSSYTCTDPLKALGLHRCHWDLIYSAESLCWWWWTRKKQQAGLWDNLVRLVVKTENYFYLQAKYFDLEIHERKHGPQINIFSLFRVELHLKEPKIFLILVVEYQNMLGRWNKVCTQDHISQKMYNFKVM